MKYLNRKLWRDVRHNWTQFFSVFLMAFLSILVFVGLQGAWKGLDTSLDHYISDANLANYWAQATNVTDNDLSKLRDLKGISKVSAVTRIQVKQNSHQLIIDSLDHPVTKLHLVKGTAYSNQRSGVWVNKEYVTNHNLKVGQTISMRYQGQTVRLKIRGIVQSVSRIYFNGTQEYIAPNYSNYGYAYVSPQTLTNEFHYAGGNNLIEIRGNHHQMRKAVEKIFGARLVVYYNRTTLPDVSSALDRVGQIRNLSYLFSFIFILLAILAMFTTIRRLIEDQMGEIATLKALGFQNRQLSLHYASFGLLVGGAGALVGAVFSPVISWFVLSTQQTMFSIPHWQLSYTYSSLAVIALVILICIGAADWAARGSMRGLPAKFLRGETESRVHHIWLERIGGWRKLSYASRWAIRDVFFNKSRVLMGIIGVAGGMMLMIAGIGMPQSINHLVDKAYGHDFTYSKRLNFNNYQQYQQTNHPNGQWVQLSQAHYSPDDGYDRLLMVISKGNSKGDYVQMKTTDGHKVEDGGVYVTQGFADRANLSKGMTLKIKTVGLSDPIKLKIKGTITSETNQGAYVTSKTWQDAGGTFQPTTLLVGKGAKYDKSAISSTITMNSQRQNAERFVNNLMSIFALIIAFAVLLIVIVLYNLGALSFVERSRDYATLSVLGIKRNELRNLTLIENLITTFVGWLIGIPAGIWFLGEYVNTFSTINLVYSPYINWITITVATVFVWICSLSTTLLISRRIRKLDMVEALKGVE